MLRLLLHHRRAVNTPPVHLMKLISDFRSIFSKTFHTNHSTSFFATSSGVSDFSGLPECAPINVAAFVQLATITHRRTFRPIQNFGGFFVASFVADRRTFFRSSRCRFVSISCFDSDFFCSKTTI